MRIEIFRSAKNGQHYFRFVARNNRILAQSEGYTRSAGVDGALRSILGNLGGAEICRIGFDGKRTPYAMPNRVTHGQ